MKTVILLMFVMAFGSGSSGREKAVVMERSDYIQNVSARSMAQCLRVIIIPKSEQVNLRLGEGSSVVVRIENTTDASIRLLHRPVFKLTRAGVPAQKTRLGDVYSARIPRGTEPQKPIHLNGRQSLDLEVDLTSLELKDELSSINVWENILSELTSGEYFIEARVSVELSACGRRTDEEIRLKEASSKPIPFSVPL